jgi:hypothetical protein
MPYSSKTLLNSWMEERTSPAPPLLSEKSPRKLEPGLVSITGSTAEPLTRIARLKPRSTSGLIARGEHLAGSSVYKEDFSPHSERGSLNHSTSFVNDGTIVELLYDSRRPLPVQLCERETTEASNWITTSKAFNAKIQDGSSLTAQSKTDIPAGVRKGAVVGNMRHNRKITSNDKRPGQYIFMDYP